jgi:hypothetical protein
MLLYDDEVVISNVLFNCLHMYTFLNFIYLFLLLCWVSTLGHLQEFLQYIKYIKLDFTPSTILLYPLLPPP